MTNWNAFYKRIRAALFMKYDDVVRACQIGGLDISRSRAEGWARGEQDHRRFVRMSEAEFDAFTRGLPEWASEPQQ